MSAAYRARRVARQRRVEAGAELQDGFVVDEISSEDGRVQGIRGSVDGGPSVRHHDGLTLGVVNWPHSEFASNRGDLEGHFMRAFELVPDLHERTRAARRESRFFGAADLPNFFRRPYGPGWTLVGDAGYHKDPITAQGISDAFHDAEALVDALDTALSGREPYDEVMARYQRARDERVTPMFELTCQFANLEEPPPAEMLQLLGASHGNREAMSGFVSVIAGVIPPSEFFGPDNVARILEQAQARQPSGAARNADPREEES